MKQKVVTIIALLIFMPMWMFGQTYSDLWGKVETALRKDLPQTAISHLTSIEKKAKKEKAYGQLLRASLFRAKMQDEIAPDSLEFAVERLCQQEKQTKDVALRAVYATVLYSIYTDHPSLSDETREKQRYLWRRPSAYHWNGV